MPPVAVAAAHIRRLNDSLSSPLFEQTLNKRIRIEQHHDEARCIYSNAISVELETTETTNPSSKETLVGFVREFYCAAENVLYQFI